MFISTLELFKVGIGPSSSHTMGPMLAANKFIKLVEQQLAERTSTAPDHIQCTLKGSLAFTGKGHATDRAVALGLHGHTAKSLSTQNVQDVVSQLWTSETVEIADESLKFKPESDIIFDRTAPLPEHSNGMIFELMDSFGKSLVSETYFSIGGGFIRTKDQIQNLVAPLKIVSDTTCPYHFNSANSLLEVTEKAQLSIAQIQRANEHTFRTESEFTQGLDDIWSAMRSSIQRGLEADGQLPGKLNIQRRAHSLLQQLDANPERVGTNEWLSVYAMAVNEENASGHSIVTAPTNGAAGVIPAVLHHFITHENGTAEQINEFLLTAAAIGGIIKKNGSISGAEVGCQGEVGSAAAMAAAGLCAVYGGTPTQVENAAEMALEHHLGMTCDPVGGLVQVPCIERNAFGAVKAHTAASLAIRGTGSHFMPLDNCIAAMKQTGLEMSTKYKETSLGGLAVSITEC